MSSTSASKMRSESFSPDFALGRPLTDSVASHSHHNVIQVFLTSLVRIPAKEGTAILTRRKGEQLVLTYRDIVIKVIITGTERRQIKLRIEAPREVRILKQELVLSGQENDISTVNGAPACFNGKQITVGDHV